MARCAPYRLSGVRVVLKAPGLPAQPEILSQSSISHRVIAYVFSDGDPAGSPLVNG